MKFLVVVWTVGLALWLASVSLAQAKPDNPDTVAKLSGTLRGTIEAVQGEGNWFVIKVDSVEPQADAAVGKSLVVSIGWNGKKPAAAQQKYVASLKRGDAVAVQVRPAKNNTLRLVEVPGSEAAEPAGEPAQGGDEDAAPAPIPETYVGREADAPWRAEAEARIEKYRKGDLTIIVRDRAGKPVPNTEVKVEMTRSAFRWGVAVRLPMIIGKANAPLGRGMRSPDVAAIETYKQKVASLFTYAGFVNDLKPAWEKINQRQIGQALDWFKEHDIRVKGHLLFWPDWGNNPDLRKQFKDSEGPSPELRDLVTQRIVTKATALKGKIEGWDAINELKNNMYSDDSLFARAGGMDAIVEWIKAARDADPDARLYVTDNSILDSRTGATWYLPKDAVQHKWVADHVFNYLTELKKRGAPFNVIGFQGHFKPDRGGNVFTPIPEVYNRLERFAQLGCDMEVTEFDLVIPDDSDPRQIQFQGDYTRDLMTVLFSHPKVTGFTFWGVWEGEMRWKQAALFRNDWTPKPNGQAFLDLVHGKWETHVTVSTDAEGKASLRGFQGDYVLTVGTGNTSHSAKAKIDADGETVVITLPE